MAYLKAAPELLGSAASDLASIRSALSAANVAAAVPITDVVAAGADEVSAVAASLLSVHAQAYQTLSAEAAAFHAQFVQALNHSANSYARPSRPGAVVADRRAGRARGGERTGAGTVGAAADR